MIVKEAFRVAVARRQEKCSRFEFHRRCASIREVARNILAPLKVGHRLGDDLVLDNDRVWLVFSLRCSGQLSLELELEADVTAHAVLDDEIGSAQSLCKQYFAVLRELFAQAAVSGAEIEEFQDRLPGMAQFQRAFGLVDGRSRVEFQVPGFGSTEFALSPLPGCIVSEQVVAIRFRPRMVGESEAMVHLTRRSRAVLRASRSEVRLAWQPNAGDRSVSQRLFAALHAKAVVEGAARAVYKSNGKLSGVLLDNLVQTASGDLHLTAVACASLSTAF